jgi:hypothetical protein
MIDFTCEQAMRIGEAAAVLKTKYGTVHRWVAYGHKGRKLEAAWMGGLLYTSKEALQRFSVQTSAAKPEGITPKKSAAHEEAMRRLTQRANGGRRDAVKKGQSQEAAVA